MGLNLNKLTKNQLLNTKICDLNLNIPYVYKSEITKLNKALKKYHSNWTPKVWISDDWYSPDGVDGFAIPLSLCHPKLIQLEKEHLGRCEGEKTKEFLKLICHETGHALDNGFKLRRLKKRQELFGTAKKTYPTSYRPRKNTNDYLDFLGDFYAQAHPEEDWAETVGYILYNNELQKKYKGTKAEIKFNYVSSVLENLKYRKKYSNKIKVDTYKSDTRTIKEYLNQKKKDLKIGRRSFSHQKLNFILRQKITKNSSFRIRKKDIISKDHNFTPYQKWVYSRFIQDINDECKKENFTLKYSKKRTIKLIEDYISQNYVSFELSDYTKVFM